MGGIGVAEGVVEGGLADAVDVLGGGDAAGGFDAVGFENSLHFPEAFGGDIHLTPVVFDVDLFQGDIGLVKINILLNFGVIGVCQVVGVDVCGDLEILVGFHGKYLLYFFFRIAQIPGDCQSPGDIVCG